MVNIAHVADLHIGSYQYGIKERQRAHKATCMKLAEAVADHDVVIVAGDVFDSAQPSPDDLMCWRHMVGAMMAKDAVVLACAGNHDIVRGSSVQWVDTVNLRPTAKTDASADVVRFSPVRELGLTVGVFDHVRKRNLQKAIGSVELPVDVLVMHQSCCGFLPSIMRPEIEQEDLAAISEKCRYLALGDLHVHKIMKVSESCIAAYPGNPEFLRLCDPISGFKFLSVAYDEKKHFVKAVASVPVDPVQKTQVFEFKTKKTAMKDPEKYLGAFNIIRHLPDQTEDAQQFVKEMSELQPDSLFHLYRDKPPKAAPPEPGDESGGAEASDFMALVEKEPSLEDKDIEIVGELWRSPTPESVETILGQDLKEQTN